MSYNTSLFHLNMSSVIVIDDHPVVRMGIIYLLEKEGHTIVAETGDGLEALDLVEKHHPDIMIIDIDINSMKGLEVIKILRAKTYPGVIIVISAKNEEFYASKSARSGANGFVSKQHYLPEIITAIKVAQTGYGYFPLKQYDSPMPNSDAGDQDRLQTLSQQEFEVFQQLIKGDENKKIALNMGLSSKTVSTYKTRLMEKLGCKNTFELFDFARRTNLE